MNSTEIGIQIAELLREMPQQSAAAALKIAAALMEERSKDEFQQFYSDLHSLPEESRVSPSV